nr:dienelactone hydrolase family protein [Asticcacaulis currens]
MSGTGLNELTGTVPDRFYTRVAQCELHRFAVKGAKHAALVLMGGGYLALGYDKEGIETALWLNGMGIEAYVLVHRLPGAEADHGVHPPDIALTDGLQAVAYLNAQAFDTRYLVGLSSGGHLAGVLSCQDACAHWAGAVIAYAPLNANHKAYKAPKGKPDYPPREKQAFYNAWPVGIQQETHAIPRLPIFLAYALRDEIVPIDHLVNLVSTAASSGLNVEAHVFADAEHGFAFRDLKGSVAQWPQLARAWMVRVAEAGRQPHAHRLQPI